MSLRLTSIKLAIAIASASHVIKNFANELSNASLQIQAFPARYKSKPKSNYKPSRKPKSRPSRRQRAKRNRRRGI